MLDAHDRIGRAFATAMQDFSQSPAMRLLASGEFKVEHYCSILREIFFYSREDPQIQVLAAVHFRGRDREVVKSFFKHAVSEIGHDQMALDDLVALGRDVSTLRQEYPLTTTVALISFPFYQINYANPVGYLGYLYFLEHMPTQAGAGYAMALEAAGVPASAMSFLAEHTTVDVGHNQLMKNYIEKLVRTEADLAAVIYALQVTARLYADMLAGAVAQAGKPIGIAVNHEEAQRLGSVDAI